MGRHHRHRKAQKEKASPNKNREHIREAILKVFRAREMSPGGGGGILVGKSEHSKGQNVKKSIDNQPLNALLDSDNQNEESPSSSQKVKRLKTASERNKLREKLKGKSHHGGHEKEVKSDIKKHLRKAEEITSQSKLGNQGTERCYSAITQNRLTVRLGLFNKGKKSHKVVRDPLVHSKSVEKRAEKDLKRILERSHDDLDTSHTERMDYRCDSQPSQAGISCPTSPVVLSHHSTPCKKDIHKSDKSGSQSLDSSPALSEIAVELISSLSSKKIFQEIDYCQETKDELQRIMKQNRRMTPPQLKMTPLSISKISSATVKRSLIQSLPPPNKSDVEMNPLEQLKTKNAARSTSSKPCSATITCPMEQNVQPCTIQAERIHSDSLLQRMVRSAEPRQTRSEYQRKENLPFDVSSYAVSDPKSILAMNDRMQALNSSQSTQPSQESRHYRETEEDIWEQAQQPQQRKQCWESRPAENVWVQPVPQVADVMGHYREHPMEVETVGNSVLVVPSFGQAVRTEYSYPMPHPQYAPHPLTREGDIWPHLTKTVTSKEEDSNRYRNYSREYHESMDILDYAEKDRSMDHYENVKQSHEGLCQNYYYTTPSDSERTSEPTHNWRHGLPPKPSKHILTPKSHYQRHALH